jgi:succinate dehydrogenase / fumarate reductase cytochrome b subunit
MNWLKWFGVRGKSIFHISYSFHRLTGLILILYLIMHISYLTSLTFGEDVYEAFIATTVTPTFLAFDILLVLVGVYHGVNGLRLILHEFGFAYDARKPLLYLSYVVILVAWLYASYKLYAFVMGV